MKVVELRAENFKKLRAVVVKPESNTVVVTGANEQGKSSLLDSIWWVLGGGDMLKKSGTKQPIRNGEKKATVRLDLGDIICTRTATASGDRLTIENKDGDIKRTPQAVLDSLVSKIAIDPLSFAAMDDSKQKEILTRLVDIGVNLDDLAQKRIVAYNKRTEENRAVKTLENQLAALIGFDDTTPENETSSASIVDEMNEAIEHNRAIDSRAAQAEKLRGIADGLAVQINSIEEKITEGKKQISMLEDKREDTVRAEERAREEYANAVELNKKAEKRDIQGYRDRLANIESENRKVRTKQQHTKINAELNAAEARSKKLSATIDNLDKTKTDALAAAQFPIDGLSFSENGITYKDVPFSQCSSAERLRVSIAIAMAANPTLRVIRITDGSLIDSKNMAIIEEMAKDNDYQVWIEKVDESGKVGVYIEDGEIKE